jgi:hypothetical protein
MSPVVIHHQVQGNIPRKLLLQSAEKLEKLLVSMPLIAGVNPQTETCFGTLTNRRDQFRVDNTPGMCRARMALLRVARYKDE